LYQSEEKSPETAYGLTIEEEEYLKSERQAITMDGD